MYIEESLFTWFACVSFLCSVFVISFFCWGGGGGGGFCVIVF